MDNQKIFNQRNSALGFKHGRSYKILKQYEREAELVPYMLLHLKEVFEDIGIKVTWTYHPDMGLEVTYKLRHN